MNNNHAAQSLLAAIFSNSWPLVSRQILGRITTAIHTEVLAKGLFSYNASGHRHTCPITLRIYRFVRLAAVGNCFCFWTWRSWPIRNTRLNGDPTTNVLRRLSTPWMDSIPRHFCCQVLVLSCWSKSRKARDSFVSKSFLLLEYNPELHPRAMKTIIELAFQFP